MLKFLSFFTLILLFNSMAKAQSRADSVVKHSPARTLTYTQYQSYLKGEAADDMAQVAEMNHYPMPAKALKWKKELALNPEQVQKITEINAYMHRRRLQIGGSVIATEKMLDSLFRYHKMDDGSLIFYTNRYGLYQGELKNAILQACLATQQALTPQQIDKLALLQKTD